MIQDHTDLANEKIVKVGYKFQVNLKSGIQEFIDYYKRGKNKKTPNAYSIDFINKIKNMNKVSSSW